MTYTREPMTKSKLIKLLENVPDETTINVMNSNGELTANITVHYEDEDTRSFVELVGLEPFWRQGGKES